MSLESIALGIGMLGFGSFGIWLLVAPQALSAVDIAAESANARAEIRAMYGGLEIGIAIFLGLCFFEPEWLQVGLVFQLLALSGIGLGRLIGILAERGQVRPLLWFFVLIEAGAAIFTLFALNGAGE